MNKRLDFNIAIDFSPYPAGITKLDGPYSGEHFKDKLIETLNTNQYVDVSLDGTMGYGSSFLRSAFGGLVHSGFKIEELRKRLTIKSKDSSLVTEVWSYIF